MDEERFEKRIDEGSSEKRIEEERSEKRIDEERSEKRIDEERSEIPLLTPLNLFPSNPSGKISDGEMEEKESDKDQFLQMMQKMIACEVKNYVDSLPFLHPD